jgi:hypothetical protein
MRSRIVVAVVAAVGGGLIGATAGTVFGLIP